MVMMIRSMAPGAVAVDEDRGPGGSGGVKIRDEMRLPDPGHGPRKFPGGSEKEAGAGRNGPGRNVFLVCGAFRRMGPGTVEAVCDGELRLLAGKGCQNEGNGAGSLETEGKAEAPGA